ncbi:MAG TPA: ABC transporter ATP-binding protein [Gemmatimonadaceae bacterium]|nr:ABC transporter ATP-binding protein [Gemmatimonadaceae bacterium]
MRSHLSLARRALSSFVRPDARRTCLTFLAALAVSVAAACEPLILKTLVDRLAAVSVAAAGAGAARAIAAGIALFAAVLAFRIIGAAWVMTSTWRVRFDFEYRLRSQVAAKLSVISARTQAEIGTGGLRYAIDASAPQSASAFTDVAFKLAPALLYIGIAAASMARLDGALALMVLGCLPLPAAVAALKASRQTARDRMQHRFWTRLWAWYAEVMHGMATVRAFANEHAEERRFTRRLRWAFACIHRGIAVDAGVTAAAGIAELAARVAVLWYGGFLILHGRMTVGTLLAFLGFVGGVFAPLQQLVDLYPAVRKAVVALTAVFAVLDAEEEAPDLPEARPAPRFTGHVRFDGVCFSYTGDRQALEELTLEIRAGETVALVGPSGSGKSTILRLLQRTHHPTSGRVLIDGHDVRELAVQSVRRQLGVVPQDVVLFNDSIAANIAYGRPRAARAEIERAARAANAHDFIMALRHGYDTSIGEGGRALSGGQRQRIAIARAFLVDPAILLLDEATAALDTESEQAVQQALRALRHGRTTLIVAHRLNTVRDADRIVVIRDGRVVGDGTHDALLASCPTYAALVRHQLGAEPGGAPAPAAPPQGVALVA